METISISIKRPGHTPAAGKYTLRGKVQSEMRKKCKYDFDIFPERVPAKQTVEHRDRETDGQTVRQTAGPEKWTEASENWQLETRSVSRAVN